jgi:hypothetical protein
VLPFPCPGARKKPEDKIRSRSCYQTSQKKEKKKNKRKKEKKKKKKKRKKEKKKKEKKKCKKLKSLTLEPKQSLSLKSIADWCRILAASINRISKTKVLFYRNIIKNIN